MASRIRYEWAVIASDHAAMSSFEGRCSTKDVQVAFASASSQSITFTAGSLGLRENVKYHVLVRASGLGQSIVSRSSGFTVPAVESPTNGATVREVAEETRDQRAVPECIYPCNNVYDPRPLDPGHSHGPKLGSPEAEAYYANLAWNFVFESFYTEALAIAENDDEDHGLSGTDKAGIVIGTVLGGVIIASIIMTIMFAGGGSSFSDSRVTPATHVSY